MISSSQEPEIREETEEEDEEEEEEEQKTRGEEDNAEPASQSSASRNHHHHSSAPREERKQNGGQQENPYQTAIEDYRSFARAQLAKSVIKLTVHPYPTNFYILKQCCGSKYIDFGSRILAQFGSGSRSGSRVMFLNLKEKLKIILEKNYQTSCHLEKCLVS